MLFQRSQRSNPNKECLSLPMIHLVNVNTANIVSVGMIDDCLLYPGDVLRLGSESDGDLLVVEAIHPTMKLLYPSILVARRYGEFIILNTAHQPTIDIEQWRILGAVKGVERSMTTGGFGVEKWWIKVFGVEGVLSSEWLDYIESMPLPPEYVSELALELSAIEGSSIQAAWTKEGLENMCVPNPNTIVFALHKIETASGFVSSWAIASKRQLRRKRSVRRQADYGRTVSLLPVPECRKWLIGNVSCQKGETLNSAVNRLASK